MNHKVINVSQEVGSCHFWRPTAELFFSICGLFFGLHSWITSETHKKLTKDTQMEVISGKLALHRLFLSDGNSSEMFSPPQITNKASFQMAKRELYYNF